MIKNKRYTLLFFLFFGFFLPPYLSVMVSYSIVTTFITIYKVLSCFIIILLYILYHKRFSYFIILILVYNFWLIISTYLNYGDLLEATKSALSMISICMLTEICLSNQLSDPLKLLFYMMSFICVMNLWSVVFYPQGLPNTGYEARYFILGNRNTHAYFLIPFSLLCFLHFKRKRVIFPIVISVTIYILTVFLVESSTSIIGAFLFVPVLLLNYLFGRNNKKHIINNIWFYAIITIGAFLLIVIIRLRIFSFLVEDYFQNDYTFSGRTYIWDTAIYWIKQRLFIGYGVESTEVFQSKILYSHVHNIYLQNLYEGGIPLLVLFLLVLGLVCKKIHEYSNNAISWWFIAAIFTFLIMFITEAISFRLIPSLYLVLTMGYHMKQTIHMFSNNNGNLL